MRSWRRLIAFPIVLGGVALAAAGARAHDNPDNKLVEFGRSGAWEVWCLDIGGTGRIACDLNIVINYVPNPNFRGMIPRVYLAEDGAPFWRLDYEAQTSFRRGHVEVDGGPRFSLAACDRPCIIEGAEARRLIDLLSQGRSATIHFHDYVVETFDVAIDLKGFAGGLDLLRALQAKHRP
jgi:hypothetical protein